MSMIETVGAFAVGAIAAVVVKDKLFGNDAELQAKQSEINSLSRENERFSNRNKELERQTEDLLAELDKVRKQAKSNESEQFDLEDDLDKAKRELKNLKAQNEELARALKDYKLACEAQEAEIVRLKQK